MELILLAVGFFLLVNGLYVAAQKYRRMSQWAPVDAEVLDFKVVNEASGQVSNGNRAHFTFQHEVQGRKLVGGAQSDHIGLLFGNWLTGFSTCQAAISKIRYNPAQPQGITTDDRRTTNNS
jgi:hypothetical protein